MRKWLDRLEYRWQKGGRYRFRLIMGEIQMFLSFLLCLGTGVASWYFVAHLLEHLDAHHETMAQLAIPLAWLMILFFFYLGLGLVVTAFELLFKE